MNPGRENRWWEDERVVTRRLAGVFEGGGAKGVAYVGALEATLAKGCWFGSVAGASVGAITAALVASGLRPAAIGEHSLAAINLIRLGSMPSGLKKLRLQFGYLDSDKIREWLAGVLATQVQNLGLPLDGPVTFSTLYQATGIELNVVAADLSRGRQIVFSAWDTPAAQVADAVVASSSIPFAFPARHLRVPYDGVAFLHTIADGGVWSNFPMFVFHDRSFRKSSGRDELVAEDHIVGFLLDEQGEADPDLQRCYFVGSDRTTEPREWHVEQPSPRSAATSRIRRTFLAILLIATSPLWLLLRLGGWLSLGDEPSWRGRWPQAHGVSGRVLRMLDDALSALHSVWFGAIAAMTMLGGAAAAVYWLVRNFILLRLDEMRFDLVFLDVQVVFSLVLQVVLVTVAITLVSALVAFVLLALVANYVLLGAGRQALFGLIRTYVAGPGAPSWVGHSADDHVFRLPIPPALKTLSFDQASPLVTEAVRQAQEDARRVTAMGLERVLITPPIRGPQRPPLSSGVPSTPATPESSQGAGPALAAWRLSILAGAVAAILSLGALILPKPKWHQYDTNVRICSEPLGTLEARCERPTSGAIAATVIFGPPTAGHLTEATMMVNGQIVERSPVISPSSQGRLIHVVDIPKLCRMQHCTVRVAALVDGKEVFSRTVELRSEVEVR